ncbi:hypothetical protein AB1Y20_012579 [Prymnesium parvum]|uniref:Sulfotransferase domain-containing protein n=1 Tax=Prymnesium parvum TaxID=97485 RepID=A0AB34IKP7_PRYPA
MAACCVRSRRRASWRRRPPPPSPDGGADLESQLRRVHSLALAGQLAAAHALSASLAAARPDALLALSLHGTLSLQRGDTAAARHSLSRAHELAPHDWRVATNLAACLLSLGDSNGATPPALAATRGAPAYAGAWQLLAKARLGAGAADEAERAAREAVRLDEEGRGGVAGGVADEAPLLTLCEALLARRELEGAKAAAARAAARAATPRAAAAAATLAARVESAAGRHEAALLALDAALKHDPSYDEARRTRLHAITPALRAGLLPRPRDVFIATYPKSGTTWMQQVVCLLRGAPPHVDVQAAAPYVEAALATGALTLRALRERPAPRVFKTHADWQSLPVAGCSDEGPAEGVRVVCVVRDPRDVCVSLFHHSRAIRGIAYGGSWDEWCDDFLAGRAPVPMAAEGGDWFDHTLSWWAIARRCPRRVLWVRYEGLLADPLGEVRRVARFLAPEHAEDEALLRRVVGASSFEQMKARHEADPLNHSLRTEGGSAHFRNGKAGDWRRHMSEAQRERFAEVMRSRLRGSGLEDALTFD